MSATSFVVCARRALTWIKLRLTQVSRNWPVTVRYLTLVKRQWLFALLAGAALSCRSSAASSPEAIEVPAPTPMIRASGVSASTAFVVPSTDDRSASHAAEPDERPGSGGGQGGGMGKPRCVGPVRTGAKPCATDARCINDRGDYCFCSAGVWACGNF